MFDVISDWAESECVDKNTGVATLECIPVVVQNVINVQGVQIDKNPLLFSLSS